MISVVQTGSYTGYRLRKLALPLRSGAVYQDMIIVFPLSHTIFTYFKEK